MSAPTPLPHVREDLHDQRSCVWCWRLIAQDRVRGDLWVHLATRLHGCADLTHQATPTSDQHVCHSTTTRRSTR